METKYLITRYKGQYNAHFEKSKGDESMWIKELSHAIGAQILHVGTLDDIKKAHIVLDVVEEANKTGEFDSKLLESRLSISTSRDE